MAKYSVTYSCGHDDEVQLYGPERERQRKMDWMRESGLCRDCYIQAKREEERKAGPLVSWRVDTYGLGLEIIVTRSYAVKDSLKARGYRFQRVHLGPIFNPLSEGEGAWIKQVGKAQLADELAWLKGQGWQMQAIPLPQSMVASIFEGRPDLVPDPTILPKEVS